MRSAFCLFALGVLVSIAACGGDGDADGDDDRGASSGSSNTGSSGSNTGGSSGSSNTGSSSGSNNTSSSSGSSSPPIEVSIDFEDLEDGDTVTDQYGPDVIFAAEAGYHVEVLEYASQAGAEPNFICIRPDGGGNCAPREFWLEFSAPLASLSLFIPAAGVQSSAGRLAFLDADQEVLDVRDLGEDDNDFLDPPAGTRAVRFVEQTDGAGIGVDDIVVTLQP